MRISGLTHAASAPALLRFAFRVATHAQGWLPAGWLAFTGRASNPLDRYERFQSIVVILLSCSPDAIQIFLETLAKKYPRQLILLFVDGAGNHHSEELEVPPNIILRLLPPYSPELNPQENLWDEIREKIFKNYALKSMDEVYAKLEDAALYIERNPALVKSITSFPYIAKSL